MPFVISLRLYFFLFLFFFFFFFFSLASEVFFPIVLAIFSFTGYSKHVLVKLSVLLKVFLFAKFLFAFFLFVCFFVAFFYVFKSSLLLFWIVFSITLLLFSVILSVELSLQVTNVLVGFTVVLISVSCFIINVFPRFTALRYSIFSLKELT